MYPSVGPHFHSVNYHCKSVLTQGREGDLAVCIRNVLKHAFARMGDAVSVRVCSYLLTQEVVNTERLRAGGSYRDVNLTFEYSLFILTKRLRKIDYFPYVSKTNAKSCLCSNKRRECVLSLF